MQPRVLRDLWFAIIKFPTVLYDILIITNIDAKPARNKRILLKILLAYFLVSGLDKDYNISKKSAI